jgi:hypothetical protein
MTALTTFCGCWIVVAALVVAWVHAATRNGKR